MEIIKFTEQQRKDYEQLPTSMAIYQIIDGKAKTLLVTDELCRLLRISREDLIANLDKSMFGFVHPDDIGRMAYFGKNFAAHTDEKYDVFFRWKTPKMEDYHIFHSWANHVLVDGVSLGFFFYSDMEESGKNNQILDTHYQKYANDQMYQDRLTNLPNRRFLEIFGMEKVAKLRLAKKQPVCITLNIAGMSVYNNLYGLKKGDLLLRELSELLVSEIKEGHVYYNKDDRFLILTIAEGIDEKIKEIHEKFVNLAHEDFEMPNLVEKINNLVTGAGLSRSLIKIEIMERDLSNNTSRLKEQIDQLRSYGFEVWMDDFASGYSSLNVLNDYSFDLVKIDMVFVRHLDDGQLNRLLISEIAKVAHKLGLKVLAEGVETEEQRDFLREAGCDLLQGFLFSKPVELDENQQVIS
ncbi:EAL domain-containing protein [Lactobacillus delbrueckii]|uniref:EAL domain-containing protein n=1 Tax=Lactobacillus delbrueckii TaxID=1584 RepID=A0ABD4W3I1_9LACO|nr:EAL domain-containing protein [Lactobacillus delbrueckii]MCT3487082.1 GGDEF domain-containing protein [Lactobacillus delbrueckii subsp. lactis]MDA3778226.1 EAL domain-containing protein [Lactobacillus delbrueckii]MDA3783148.1 EAL domain-containing protein [Lactobacillus delbrueckii]MDA3795143.1 EAL domain-containing protein [Lactobacillus delbrueckii]MDA3842371.1 EAL domain-containing protein [Lactobacillus delbrueckii]